MTPNELERAEALGNLTSQDMESVMKRLATSCLGAGWLTRFVGDKSRKPAIRFYPMRNRTSYHINTTTMVKLLETELSRSGKVTLVADLEAAQALRADRADAARNASDEAVKRLGNETAADLIATGWITGVTDAVSSTETVHAFTIVMELVNTETEEKVWIGNESVKKVVQVLPPCPGPAGKAAPK